MCGACVVCVIRRWIERGPSLSVSAGESKVVCAWFWVLNGSKKLPTQKCASMCVIYESACVLSRLREYARDTRRPSVLMRRNLFETAHVHVRPLTPQFHITHEQRRYHVHLTDIHWPSLTQLKCAICQWFVSRILIDIIQMNHIDYVLCDYYCKLITLLKPYHCTYEEKNRYVHILSFYRFYIVVTWI